MTIVSGAGPEFVSDSFGRYCKSIGSILTTCSVDAPFQTGIAERHGGLFKAKLAAIVKQHSAVTRDEVMVAASAATEAANRDVGVSGYTPYQR